MARSSSALDVFHAIADASRRTILDALAAAEAPVGELTKATSLSYSAVSQHLAVLHEVGLVERRKEGKQRFYRIRCEPLREVHDWTNRYERFWRERLDRLKRVLRAKR